MSLRTPEGVQPSTKGWDFIKRGLWQREDRARRAGNNELASSLARQRRQLTQDLRDQNEDYGKALDTWSGGKGVLDAMEAGRAAIRKNSQDVADELADLNEREAQGYRLGYARSLLGRIEGEGFTGGITETGDTARIFNKPDAQRSLEVVFGSRDDAISFLDRARNESQMQRTYDMMRGGSPTYSNLAEAQSQAERTGVGEAILNYALGNQSPVDVARSLARNRMRTIPTVEPEFAGALTRQLGLESPAAFIARTRATSPRGIPVPSGARTAGAIGGGATATGLTPFVQDLMFRRSNR